MDCCPVCKKNLSKPPAQNPLEDTCSYECNSCGKFNLSGTLVAQLNNGYLDNIQDGVTKLSHAIRQRNSVGEAHINAGPMLKAILESPLPRPREQADLLLRWLAVNISGPGEAILIDSEKHRAIIGAKSGAGFALIVKHLIASGLIDALAKPNAYLNGEFGANVTLSFAGWEKFEALRVGGAIYRKAFMAMKFGDPLLEDFLQSVFKPAAKRAGFELTKLNDVPKAGLIDDHLRVEIQSSDFVVADLSHDNLGAYWEAGYAEGLGKPVIYTCEKSKFEQSKTHFDTNHHLTVIWCSADKTQAEENLLATIRATLPHLAIMNDKC